jgi:hypothetical protein
LTYPQGFSTGDFENYFGGDFCIGCLGRVTAISRKADEWREIKALIRKLDEARLTLDRGLVDHLRLPQLRKAATPPD